MVLFLFKPPRGPSFQTLKPIGNFSHPRHHSQGHTQGEPYEHPQRRMATCKPRSQAFRKEKTINFTDTLILENCEKIPFCCLSHPACSVLLQEPWPTNAHWYSIND